MTSKQVIDYLANECGGYPYFDRYGKGNSIYVKDEDGNEFKVTVTKERKH